MAQYSGILVLESGGQKSYLHKSDGTEYLMVCASNNSAYGAYNYFHQAYPAGKSISVQGTLIRLSGGTGQVLAVDVC